MLENFLTVGQQVIILFLLVGVGYVCGKVHFIAEKTVSDLSNLVLYIVFPCVMIHAFQREFDASLSTSFFYAFLLAAIMHILAYIVARLTLHDADARRKSVYHYSILFPNCAFMGLPLLNALLGSDGLFYGAAVLAVTLIFTWTLGVYIMNPSGALSWKKLLLNPGIIGVVIGLALFFTSTTLPEVVATPIEYLAALNTPIPMLIIGFHLSHAKIGPILKNYRTWLASAERLLILPLLGVAIGLLLNMDATPLLACTVSLCTPTAAMCTMFAVTYKQDTELSVSIVSLNTLLSLISMPVIIVLTQTVLA